jgi:hypothetical protein
MADSSCHSSSPDPIQAACIKAPDESACSEASMCSGPTPLMSHGECARCASVLLALPRLPRPA